MSPLRITPKIGKKQDYTETRRSWCHLAIFCAFGLRRMKIIISELIVVLSKVYFITKLLAGFPNFTLS